MKEGIEGGKRVASEVVRGRREGGGEMEGGREGREGGREVRREGEREEGGMERERGREG